MCISLTGCAVSSNPTASVAFFAQGTKVSYDPYLRYTAVAGPRITLSSVVYFLDRINGQDYIVGSYVDTDWAFLHAAFDIDGHQLTFGQPDHQVGDGVVQERFNIALPSSYLRDHFSEDIKIRIVGTNKSVDISMNPMYIQGFLSKAESQ